MADKATQPPIPASVEARHLRHLVKDLPLASGGSLPGRMLLMCVATDLLAIFLEAAAKEGIASDEAAAAFWKEVIATEGQRLKSAAQRLRPSPLALRMTLQALSDGLALPLDGPRRSASRASWSIAMSYARAGLKFGRLPLPLGQGVTTWRTIGTAVLHSPYRDKADAAFERAFVERLEQGPFGLREWVPASASLPEEGDRGPHLSQALRHVLALRFLYRIETALESGVGPNVLSGIVARWGRGGALDSLLGREAVLREIYLRWIRLPSTAMTLVDAADSNRS